MTTLEIGTVISIPERKRNIYKITDIKRTQYRIHRCENDPKNGYPLASDKTTYMYPIAKEGIQVIGKGTAESTEVDIFTYGSEAHKEEGVSIESLEKNVFVPRFVVKAFQSLENELSPENLFCDGEISRSAAMAKKAKIDRLWSALEGYIGKKVTGYGY
jgi:hypothetical protein